MALKTLRVKWMPTSTRYRSPRQAEEARNHETVPAEKDPARLIDASNSARPFGNRRQWQHPGNAAVTALWVIVAC
jgi:hypothetical protein